MRLIIGIVLSYFALFGKVNAQAQSDTFTLHLDQNFSEYDFQKKVIYPLVRQGFLTAGASRVGPFEWFLTKGRRFSYLVNTEGHSDSIIRLSQYNKWAGQWLKEQNSLGYPFANVRPALIKQRSDTLEMEILKSYGDQWYYDSVVFDNFSVSPRLLKWAAGIDPKVVVSDRKNKLLLERLIAINGFSSSNPKISYSKSGNSQWTHFTIHKSRKDFLSGIVGLNTDASGNRTITGELNGEFYNVMNSGSGMQFSWQSFRARSQDFKMSAQVPFIFGLPFITTGDFEFQKFDTLYTSTNRGLGFQFPMSKDFIIGVQYNLTDRSRIFTDESYVRARRELPNSPNSKARLYGLQLHYRKGDFSYFSRSKISVRAALNVGSRMFIKDASIAAITWISSSGKVENVYDSLERTSGLKSNQLSANLDFNWHVPLNKLFVLRTFSTVNVLQLPQVFFNELSRYGGIKTLLGFNEQSIFANEYYSLGMELRLVTGDDGFIGLQSNVARYINSTGQGGLANENIFGAGITTAINTRAGVLQIAWAMGQGVSSTFGFNQSRFHFGLVTNLNN